MQQLPSRAFLHQEMFVWKFQALPDSFQSSEDPAGCHPDVLSPHSTSRECTLRIWSSFCSLPFSHDGSKPQVLGRKEWSLASLSHNCLNAYQAKISISKAIFSQPVDPGQNALGGLLEMQIPLPVYLDCVIIRFSCQKGSPEE